MLYHSFINIITFQLGSLLTEEEYQKRIVPCVVKLFSSPDRATRVRLLQQLEHFSTHLLPVTVNDNIFPHILSGFTDSNPIIREHTVKVMKMIYAYIYSHNFRHLFSCCYPNNGGPVVYNISSTQTEL